LLLLAQFTATNATKAMAKNNFILGRTNVLTPQNHLLIKVKRAKAASLLL
jgi:hypothetical protein